jgi:hypothetical protein
MTGKKIYQNRKTMEETSKFRTKIDDFIDGKTGNKGGDVHNGDRNPDAIKYTSVNFVWSDGKQHAFTYSYMVSVSFEKSDTENVIIANFASHNVTVRGYKLYPIYDGLMNHTVNQIEQSDGSRFGSLSDTETPEVREIEVS